MPPLRPRNGENPQISRRTDRASERLSVSWVDLLDFSPTARVLLVDSGARGAETDLRARTPYVDVVDRDELPQQGRYDLVCVDGVRLTREQRRLLGSLLSPEGRWAQVSDNALSPLRAHDLLRGGDGGRDARVSLRRLRRVLRRELGLEPAQVFALLRSSVRPITAFDLMSRTGTAHTVAASLTHIHGVRGAILGLARWSPRRLVARFSPGWLVLAAAPAAVADPRRVVGKVANNDSKEIKILRGDPPVELEKRFILTSPSSEAAALRELAELGFTLAPQILGVDDTTVRYGWRAGDTLPLEKLTDDEVVLWTGRAAAVLRQLHDVSRHEDGSVLVHGDYWLGNLLVEGDRVCCVLDWTKSHRGAPDVDRQFLVDSLRGRRAVSPQLEARITRTVREQLGEAEAVASPTPPPPGRAGGPATTPVSDPGGRPGEPGRDDGPS